MKRIPFSIVIRDYVIKYNYYTSGLIKTSEIAIKATSEQQAKNNFEVWVNMQFEIQAVRIVSVEENRENQIVISTGTN